MWSHNSGKITFYHYTTEKNARRILNEKVIWQSEVDNGDAVLGDGVYLTDMAPKCKSKEEIAYNNWGQLGQFKVKKGHMDAAIKVKLSVEVLSYMKKQDRFIYLYEGDLWLPGSAELILWDDVRRLQFAAQAPVKRVKRPSYVPCQSRETRQENTSDLSPWKLLKGLAIGAATIGAVGVAAAALASDPDRKKSNKK